MRSVASAAAFAAALFVSASAQAATTVLVQEDFEGYGAGSQANFTGFADLNVTDGAVDLLTDAGIVATPYGTGFVDLDGSTGNGGYLRTDLFSFQAGDVVTFEFDYAGNRRGAPDSFIFGLRSTGIFSFQNATISNGVTTTTVDNLLSQTLPGLNIANLHGAAPWRRASITFTAGQAGSLSAFVGTDSADNVGPLVDNFKLSVTSSAAPEPAAWSMMLTGFGAAGALLRRRRALA